MINFCRYWFTKRQIEPNNISFAIYLGVWILISCCFVWWVIWKSCFDCNWNLFDDIWRVIVSQQIATQNLLGKSYEDTPPKSCNIKMQSLFKWKVGNGYRQGKSLLNKRSELVSKHLYFNKLLLMNSGDNITWWQAKNVPFCCPRSLLVKL